MHRSLRTEGPEAQPDTADPDIAEPAITLTGRIFATAHKLALGHRQTIKAGVPGCTCGTVFDSHRTFISDHAEHLSGELVVHVLDAAVGAILSTQEACAGNADVGQRGGHDTKAAVAAVCGLVRPLTAIARIPEKVGS